MQTATRASPKLDLCVTVQLNGMKDNLAEQQPHSELVAGKTGRIEEITLRIE
jgi:hypothetical protein